MTPEKREKPFDVVVSAIADLYRRQLLVALLDHNPQKDDDCDPLDLVSEGDEPDVLETELIHNHLPRLDDMGYIMWDRTANEISKGSKWDEIEPLLTLIDNHQDELPVGWL